MKKYYKVTMRRGHVGRGYTAHITFYVWGYNSLHAMDIARKMPGVKHNELPVSCVEISQEEFLRQKSTRRNAYEACGAKLALK